MKTENIPMSSGLRKSLVIFPGAGGRKLEHKGFQGCVSQRTGPRAPRLNTAGAQQILLLLLHCSHFPPLTGMSFVLGVLLVDL